MPKNHISGNYKQKNKPFKGGSNKNKHKFKIECKDSVITKKINKKDIGKTDRRNQLDQLKQTKNQSQETELEKKLVLNQIFETDTKEKVYNTLRNVKPPKIIALVPFNENANAFNIKNGLETYIKNLQAQHEEVEMGEQNQQQQQDNLSFQFPYFQLFANPKTMQGLVKDNFIFVPCDRNIQNILDVCKVADIICPILSCQGCQIDQTNLNPYDNANAFDDYAYRIMSCLRIQGMAPTLNILQDLDKFSQDKRPKVKKLFSRFFAGEFSENVVSLEDESSILTYLRKLQSIPLRLLTWREQRGYLLADKVNFNQQTNQLEVTGFLKGNYINANQLVHITGYDDYQLDKIEVLKNPYKLKLKTKKQKKQGLLEQHKRRDQNNKTIMDSTHMEITQTDITCNTNMTLDIDQDIIMSQTADPNQQESIEQIIKKDLNHFVIKDGNILNAIDEDEGEGDKNKNQIEEDFTMNDHNDINNQQQQKSTHDVIEKLIGQEKEKKKLLQQQQGTSNDQNNNNEDEMEDEEEIEMDDNEEDDVSFDENEMQQEKDQMLEEKKQIKQIELVKREEDELQFEDEVEYDADILLKEQYGDYQALKSFKTSEWDPLENLPDPYEQIYTFKHYQKTKRLAMDNAQENAFAYAGFYVKLYIKNFPVQTLQNHNPNTPFIISGLLRHERKMTQVHLKVKRNPEMENTLIESNKQVEINLGFRRFAISPIYSKIYAQNPKTKYTQKIEDDNQYVCSFYYPCIYGGNALIFDNLENKNSAKFALSGEIFKVDPMHVILERIILTGYPHKIHKRRAVIKFMFFNVPDIRYFQPVELKTKLGLRGNIVMPLGTHGLMKCQFNTQIKQHDVIQMHLYKRVFPANNF